ncbi:MAG: dihydrofolate reductase [Patescibacteria group bacterium]
MTRILQLKQRLPMSADFKKLPCRSDYRAPRNDRKNIMTSIIAIIAKNRAIGFQNKLLYDIPEDMKHFKKITAGYAVIMGERTFHSMNDCPLPNRINIILTKDKNFTTQNCLIAYSIEESIKLAKAQNKDEIFFIGGGQIYKQALPLADKLYLTIVDDEPKQADAFFPDYSEFKKIIIKKESELNNLKFKFVELER